LFIPDAKWAGTSERTPGLLRILKARYPVVALAAPWDRFLYDPARARWPRALLYGIDKVVLTIRGLFLGRRFRANVVFCETAHHALAGLAIARMLGIRCVWDSHGNGTLFYESLRKSRSEIRLVSTLERFLGKRVDCLVTVSEADAAAYAEMGLPRSKIHVVPVCTSLAEIDASLATVPAHVEAGERGPPALLFFGSFQYEPNREALEFINAVLAPQLELLGIRCEIRIAGRDIPKLAFHPRLRVLGFVPDIYSCIHAADLCIVPVRRGIGELTKVIDSMAVGTPLVLSEFAAKSVAGIQHGIHAYVATTDAEFLQYVVESLSDRDAARAMSRRARQFVERKHDWDAYATQLDVILRGSSRTVAGGEGHEGRNHRARS